MEPKICIVGLGYVGIQLACEFVQHGIVYGYDINEQKIYEYKHHIDKIDLVFRCRTCNCDSWMSGIFRYPCLLLYE